MAGVFIVNPLYLKAPSMIESFSARTTTVGGIPIARLLPNRNKQPIGAWCFLDHAGPAQLDAHNDGIQVGLHPHINLQTFTWMLSGEILHQDSLGNEQIIRPKQINLMTAGTGNTRGIAHTERSIFESAAAHRLLHAVQLWIALPVHQDIEPGFHHYPELPAWHEQGAQFTLLTGQYAGQRAPTLQYSPLIGMDIVCQQAGELNLTLQPGFEYGIMVLTGTVRSDGQTFSPNELGKLSVQNAPQSLQISVQAGICSLSAANRCPIKPSSGGILSPTTKPTCNKPLPTGMRAPHVLAV